LYGDWELGFFHIVHNLIKGLLYYNWVLLLIRTNSLPLIV